MRAKNSGANLLPFGLLTIVPSEAPVAGVAGLAGMVKGSAGSTEQSGFEQALGALAEAAPGEEGPGSETAEAVSGSFALPFDAVFQKDVQTIAFEFDGGNQPDLPAAQGDPENQASLPDLASANLPVSPAGSASVAAPAGEPDVEAAAPPATIPSSSAEKPAQPAAGTVADVPAVPRPAAAGEELVAAGVKDQVSADVRPAHVVPVKPVPAEAVPAEDVPAEAVKLRSHGSGVETQSVSGAVTLSAVPEPGNAIDREPELPLVKPAVEEAPRVQNSSPEVSPAGEVNRALVAGVVTDEVVAQPAPVDAHKTVSVPVQQVERRWQSELPNEFRAPGLTVSQPASDIQQQNALPVTVDAEVPANPSSQVENSRPVTLTLAEAAPAGIAEELPVTKPGQIVANQKAVPDVPAASAPSAPSLPSQDAVAEPALPETVAKPVADAVQVRTAPQPSGAAAGQQVVARVSPEPAAVIEENPGDPELAEEPVTPRSTTGARVDEAPVKAGHNNKPVGVEQAAKAASGGAELKPASGTPLAAAFLASQLVEEELQSAGQFLEGNLTGEFGATVRGGDGAGAMRTESLQAPTQAQSGQVATQVAAEIARNLKNGQTRFQMRFDPPELGRVEVNMRVGADGGVHAHLIVDRPETLDMFLRDQRGLERALEAAGLNADSENLQFSLKQEGGREFASGDGQSDNAGQTDHGQDGDGIEDDARSDEEIVRLTLASRRGGLDLKI